MVKKSPILSADFKNHTTNVNNFVDKALGSSLVQSCILIKFVIVNFENMFKLFGKKKITEDVVANIFVNSIIDTIDKGFLEVAGIINDAPEFVVSPAISAEDDNAFTLIVIAANLHYIPHHVKNEQAERVADLIITKLGRVFDCEATQLAATLKEYERFLMKKNLPSKNMNYAISKGIFWKYNLNEFQDKYFKNLKSPNPMFLKTLDKAMDNFIWNWTAFMEKHQIV